MRRVLAFLLLNCAIAAQQLAAQQAPIPMTDEIGGHPFAIRDKWVIGGSGNWDYLTLDPVARQLFIAHQNVVQVVDIASGEVAGEITGFQEARSIVLDPDGQFGYVSDSQANAIGIFDRRSLRLLYDISLLCAPRSMALAAQQQLLFAFCGAMTSPTPKLANLRHPPANEFGSNPPPPAESAVGQSHIIAIDLRSRSLLVNIAVYGNFRIAQADSEGQVFVTVGAADYHPDPQSYAATHTPPRIARIDAATLEAEANDQIAALPKTPPDPRSPGAAKLSWQVGEYSTNPAISFLRLDESCPSPQGLAIDRHNARLFVACDNQNLLVMDSVYGRVLNTLTTGPGTDAIAYDENHGLIFTANGGGYGSLTVVRRHQTDDYAVIQNLPTMERARTLAVDQSTGQVYLVTDLHGVDLHKTPANGIGSLKPDAVAGSFQVLVVGN
jgi:DNA-binding beta-propeller fold protein YncE